MKIHGFDVTYSRHLVDRDGLVSFSKHDGCWSVYGITAGSYGLLEDAGLNSTPTDMTLRELIQLAHEITGSSLKMRYHYGGNVAYTVDNRNFTIWNTDRGWQMVSYMFRSVDDRSRLTPLYRAYAGSVAGKMFSTRKEMLGELREAIDAGHDGNMDIEGFHLRLLYSWHVERGGMRMWAYDDRWHISSIGQQFSEQLRTHDVSGRSHYHGGDTARADFITSVADMLDVSEQHFQHGRFQHQRYAIVGTGLSLLQGAQDCGTEEWDDWVFVADGTEWLSDMPREWWRVYQSLHHRVFRSPEAAIAELRECLTEAEEEQASLTRR